MITLQEYFKHDACYFGERGHWLVVYTRNRDSELLTESNWDAMLQTLGGESEAVAIERASHWAVGWVEYLIVDPCDGDKRTIADDLLRRMYDYPVLNEFDLSEREWDALERDHDDWHTAHGIEQTDEFGPCPLCEAREQKQKRDARNAKRRARYAARKVSR